MISLETAKIAKEKGFNETTDFFYSPKYNGDYPVNGNGCDRWNEGNNAYAAPKQSQLEEWFRTKHNIYLSIRPERSNFVNNNELVFVVYLHRNTEDKLIQLDALSLSQEYDKVKEIALKELFNYI